MQTAKAYLELIRERGKKGLPLERVYRQLFNRDLRKDLSEHWRNDARSYR